MNKKFSTLVAALLASGGLFYAVDAMILPDVDGGAKYVMVQTRAASPAEYTVKGEALSAELTFENAKIWKGKANQSATNLVTANGSYIGKAATGEVVLLPASGDAAPDGAVAFTFEGENLKSGTDFLIVNTTTGALSLKATPGAGEAFVGVFTAVGTVANTASTTEAFALGQNVKEAAEIAVSSQVAAGYSETTAEKLSLGTTISDGTFTTSAFTVDASNKVSFSTPDGRTLYLKQNDATLEFVDNADDASAISLNESTYEVKIGTKFLQVSGSDIVLGSSVSTGNNIYAYPKSGGSQKQSITAGEIYLAKVADDNKGSIGSADADPIIFTPEELAQAEAANITNLSSVDATSQWTVKDGKIGASKSLLTGSADADMTLAATSEVTFTLCADGRLKSGSNYLAIVSNKLQLKAEGDGVKYAYLYAVSTNTVSGTPKLGTGEAPADGTYVIAERTESQVALANGAQVLTAVEKAATPADPEAGGNLTVAPDATTPVLVKLGENLLIVDGGKVKTIAASEWSLTDGAKAAAASWLVNNGKYESVALKNAGEAKRFLDVAPGLKSADPAEATAFALTANGGTFAYYTDATNTTTTISGTFKFGYTKQGANVFFTNTGAKAENYAAAAATKLAASSVIAQAPENTTHEAYSLVKNDGNYYLLSVDGGQNYLSWNGTTLEKKTSAEVVSAENAGAVSATDDALKNVLWKVTESTFGGVKHYTLSTVASTTDKPLVLGGGSDFESVGGLSYNTNLAVQLQLNGATSKTMVITDATNGIALSQAAQGETVATFGLYAAPGMLLDGKYLTEKLGNGFDVTIAIDKDFKKTSIEENPFTGTLTPVRSVAKTNNKVVSTTANANTDKRFYLQNAAGDFIVLDTESTWGESSESLNGENSKDRGYKLTTISKEDFWTMTVGETGSGDADMKAQYKYTFGVSYSAGVYKASDAKALAINVYNTGASTESDLFGKLYVATVDGKNMLTTSNSIETDGSRVENWPFIKFGGSNLTDIKTLLKGKFVTIVNANTAAKYNSKGYGKVYAINTDSEAGYVDASKVLLTSPEAQWAVTKSGSQLVFTNREDPTIALTAQTLYNVEADDVYAFAGSQDTVKIEFVNNATKFDGFANLDENALRDEQFKIAAYLPVTENAYLTENHAGKHQIGLDKNAANAVIWSLTKEYAGRPDKKVSRIDTVYVVSTLGYYDGNDYKSDKKDTLAILPYIVKNDANGEYVRYGVGSNIKDNDLMKYYVCNPFNGESTLDEAGAKAAAQRFALKMKPNGTYNLVEIDQTDDKIGSYKTNTLGDLKMYAGTSENNGITNRADIYDQTENDLFVVEKMDAPAYRKIAMGDTIRIYRAENDAQVVYEKGEFLSIANAVQFPKINPALYVDTAYVDRGNNNRWEYLLTVEAVRKIVNDDCGIPSHEKFHADTTYGRFLVNLMDSANVYAETHIHDNKYINEEDGESYAKLGFVKGYHTKDSLFVERVAGKFDRLPMDRKANSHSVAKFAFRIVDQDTKSFVIETGRKDFGSSEYAEKPGYLKWLNGVLVVVDDVKKADIFNLNADETRIPTANEGINASEVSVIAKEGAVVINGAQGKKVTISNVLGQTIANTVLSSDNATLSAPAGIVVVAVEGEAAVKAIVK